jgi:hypothetical protein
VKGGSAREERRGVPVTAQAEQHEIETGRGCGSRWANRSPEYCTQYAFIGDCGLGRFVLAPDTIDVRLGKRYVIE